jgi:hypothetical protein
MPPAPVAAPRYAMSASQQPRAADASWEDELVAAMDQPGRVQACGRVGRPNVVANGGGDLVRRPEPRTLGGEEHVENDALEPVRLRRSVAMAGLILHVGEATRPLRRNRMAGSPPSPIAGVRPPNAPPSRWSAELDPLRQREQLGCWEVETGRQAPEARVVRVALAGLNVRDPALVQVGAVGQLLLSQPELLAAGFDREAQGELEAGRRHGASLPAWSLRHNDIAVESAMTFR